MGGPGPVLDLGGRLGSAVFHRGLKRGVVAFVLVGVGFGEVGDRLVECAGAAEVGGQRHPVAGAGVRPGQSPSAQAGVDPQARGERQLDRGGECSIGAENFQSLSWRT